MASQDYLFSGECKWAKLKEVDAKYDIWTMDFYPDEKSLERMKEAGVNLKTRFERTDEDEGDDSSDFTGKGPFFKLKRKQNNNFSGKIVVLDPPTLLDEVNKPLDVLVGNGSKVTVRVQVYDTQVGKGHRLEAVRVDELVEYAGKTVDAGDIDLPF